MLLSCWCFPSIELQSAGWATAVRCSFGSTVCTSGAGMGTGQFGTISWLHCKLLLTLHIFLCLFAPCRMGMWLPSLTNVLCLWEAQIPLFCSLCGWSQVVASHRYLGAIGQMGARFNLKVSFQERSWEADFGCLCDWCCWQSSYSSVLTLKGSFSKKMVEMSALIIPLTSCIFPYNPNLFITRHSTVLILRGHVLDCLKQLSFFLPAYWSRCTWYNTIIIKVTEQKYSKIAVRPLQCALIVQNTEWELEKKVMEKRKDSFSWHEREQIVSVESKGQLVLLLARKVSSSLYQREGLAGSGSTLLST